MKETLLIIALVIAILFDAIRIYQYIKMRKLINQEAKDALFGKIERLVYQWVDCTDRTRFSEYLRNHWEDKQ